MKAEKKRKMYLIVSKTGDSTFSDKVPSGEYKWITNGTTIDFLPAIMDVTDDPMHTVYYLSHDEVTSCDDNAIYWQNDAFTNGGILTTGNLKVFNSSTSLRSYAVDWLARYCDQYQPHTELVQLIKELEMNPTPDEPYRMFELPEDESIVGQFTFKVMITKHQKYVNGVDIDDDDECEEEYCEYNYDYDDESYFI